LFPCDFAVRQINATFSNRFKTPKEMKPIITLFFAGTFFSAHAQVTPIMDFKPSVEAFDGLKTKGINFALLPNKSFFMIELGAEWADYGNVTNEFLTESVGEVKTKTPTNSMAYTLTIGGSIFDGTNSPIIDLIPFAFVSMNNDIAATGGGVKVLRCIRALNLYVGGYTKYTFSDYTKFLDAGFSINYYFAE
jgi:hypothetical protein